MALPLDRMVSRVASSRGYRRDFQRAYGGPVSTDGVARALSVYLRTLRPGDTPFDRFRAGDAEALSANALRGLQLFVGKARCGLCHSGFLLSDGEFHNTGGTIRSGDPGRARVTGNAADHGAFRTPTLRNINRTVPYMHDGALATLAEVIDFYDAGGLPNPNLSRELRPLGLSPTERADLLASEPALCARRRSSRLRVFA